MQIKLRSIQAADNEAVAAIIRNTLLEFGAARAGTMYYDPSVYTTFEHFQKEGCAYFVVETEDKIVGGGGIFRTEGLSEGTVELARVYLLPEARGKGIGKQIIQHCEAVAQSMGYQHLYLETTKELIVAIPLYEKLGFEYLKGPLGNSGHFGCEIQMRKMLH